MRPVAQMTYLIAYLLEEKRSDASTIHYHNDAQYTKRGGLWSLARLALALVRIHLALIPSIAVCDRIERIICIGIPETLGKMTAIHEYRIDIEAPAAVCGRYPPTSSVPKEEEGAAHQ